MTAVFLIMPNGRVRFLSAVIGGVVGGILWQLTLVLYVNLQVGVAQYNALYAGFGALPIFLVWVYVSWLVVLLAAELAASHQNEQVVRQRMRAREVDQAMQESVAVLLTARAARAYLAHAARPSSTALADELAAPPQTVEEIADALIAGGVLAASSDGDGERTFLPARDVDGIRISDLLAVMRHRTHPRSDSPDIELRIEPGIARALDELGKAAAHAQANLTARELAARLETSD
jgi:membrane protein